VKVWLLDTGPVVAFLDANDPYHDLVRVRLSAHQGGFCTTSAIIFEAMHFLSVRLDAAERLVTFLAGSRTHILEPTDQLAACISLMRKYADTPMDFGDATLVWAADAIAVYDICTLDFRGFSIFRTASGKPFNLVLR
jgi:hypothetical protein